MNAFQIKALEVAQQSNFLASVARQGQKILRIDDYSYNITIATPDVPLVSGQTAQGFINFQSDSDFVIYGMSATAVGTQLVTAQITDTGSSRTFYNEPTLIANIFGTGGFPYVLPTPKVVAPSTNLKIDVFNVSAASDLTNLFVSFSGGRIYYAS